MKRKNSENCSNNTNKHSPQEPIYIFNKYHDCSNNTNKHSPQEQRLIHNIFNLCSNNTNKHSPQEPVGLIIAYLCFIYSIS